MRGLIVDLDDTLYPHEAFVLSGFDAVADYVASSWRRERDRVRRLLHHAYQDGRRGRELQALCLEERLPLSALPALIQVIRTHLPMIVLTTAVQQALQQLRVSGWRIAVLTNGHADVQRLKVRALGLAPLVDAVVYAEEHAEGGKPHPDAYRAALRCLSLPADRCVCVGDNPVTDVEGPHRMGIRSIRIAGTRAFPEIPALVDGWLPATAAQSSRPGWTEEHDAA